MCCLQWFAEHVEINLKCPLCSHPKCPNTLYNMCCSQTCWEIICFPVLFDFFVSDVAQPSTEELEEYAYQTGLFEPGRWPNARWWTLFKDEQLSELMNIGIVGSPNLAAAKNREGLKE